VTAVDLQLPASPEYLAVARARLATFLAQAPIAPEAVFDLQVALSEACANVIRHARTSQFTLRFTLEERAVTVEVKDRGPGFDPAILDRAYAAGGASGRGFLLMRALTDQVDVETTPAGTTVRLIKRAVVPGAPPRGRR
jgi:serine/threonine-protein kinase RsbW